MNIIRDISHGQHVIWINVCEKKLFEHQAFYFSYIANDAKVNKEGSVIYFHCTNIYLFIFWRKKICKEKENLVEHNELGPKREAFISIHDTQFGSCLIVYRVSSIFVFLCEKHIVCLQKKKRIRLIYFVSHFSVWECILRLNDAKGVEMLWHLTKRWT